MTLRIALGEFDSGWHSPGGSLRRIDSLAQTAAAGGAELLVLPEMCTTGFTMAADEFAERVDGATLTALSDIARCHALQLVAGVATREEQHGATRFFNSSIAIDAKGLLEAEYRKQRLFRHAAEHDVYTAGRAPVIVPMNDLHVALLICYDLRFPELFREVAPYVDAIIVSANWPSQRQSHWEVLLRARAIESQAWVIGVNRLGDADGLRYAGGSVVHDPWGETVASGAGAIATIDAAAVTEARRRFPFVEDRRPRR